MIIITIKLLVRFILYNQIKEFSNKKKPTFDRPSLKDL